MKLTAKQKKDLKTFHSWKLKPEKIRTMTGLDLSTINNYYEELNLIQTNNRLAQELIQAQEEANKLKLQVEALEALKKQRENNNNK